MAISNARNGYINGTTSGWVARSLFAVGDNWYAVVLNTSAVLIEVHKSTDGGVTWTEMDSGDSLGHSGATHSYDANMPLSGSSTDFIYVAYRTATNTVRVRRFDTSTDTWESTDIGSADASTTAHSDFGLGLAIRSDDDVILVYRNSSDNDLYHRIYEGSSWAAQVAIHTTNTSIPLSITMTDNSDMAHVLFFESTGNDITQCSIDNANTLGTSADIDATARTGPIYSAFMGYVNDGGTHHIATLINDSGGEFDMARSTSSSAPTWTTTTAVSPTTTSDPGIMGGVVVAFDTRWHTIWSGDARGSIHADVCDDFSTPAFGTDRDVVTSLANDPAVYAAASVNGVGVLYTDFTTPSVDFAWAWGAQPTAITARTPTLDTTSVAATTHSVTIPTGLADDDVVYIWLACNGGSITNGPTGFTEIANENTQANPKYSVWRKVITNAAGESAWNFATSSITKTSICVAFIGVDTTTPEDVAENTGTNSTGSNASLVAGVTTATDDALLVWSVTLNSSTADIYEPPIMVKFGETTGTKRQMVAYEPRPTAGATGSRTGGSSSASLPWGAIMFAIRPASAGGGGTYDTPANNIALGTPAPTYSFAANYTTAANDIALGTPAPTYSFAANYTTTANNIALGTPAPDWSRNSDPFETPANNIALGAPSPTYSSVFTYTTDANTIALGTPAPTYTFAAVLLVGSYTGQLAHANRLTGAFRVTNRYSGTDDYANRLIGISSYADRVTGKDDMADQMTGTMGIA